MDGTDILFQILKFIGITVTMLGILWGAIKHLLKYLVADSEVKLNKCIEENRRERVMELVAFRAEIQNLLCQYLYNNHTNYHALNERIQALEKRMRCHRETDSKKRKSKCDSQEEEDDLYSFMRPASTGRELIIYS